MSDIDLTYNTVLPIVGITFGLGLVLWMTIVPQYINPQYPQNKNILYAIILINFLLSIILLLILYVYNSNMKDNIIHLSLMFTFLVAFPATLYNVGVSSLIFSNT
jgi:threonine/homoserine/homoserine lactone efflux protein